jgi:hypothetical protein
MWQVQQMSTPMKQIQYFEASYGRPVSASIAPNQSLIWSAACGDWMATHAHTHTRICMKPQNQTKFTLSHSLALISCHISIIYIYSSNSFLPL